MLNRREPLPSRDTLWWRLLCALIGYGAAVAIVELGHFPQLMPTWWPLLLIVLGWGLAALAAALLRVPTKRVMKR